MKNTILIALGTVLYSRHLLFHKFFVIWVRRIHQFFADICVQSLDRLFVEGSSHVTTVVLITKRICQSSLFLVIDSWFYTIDGFYLFFLDFNLYFFSHVKLWRRPEILSGVHFLSAISRVSSLTLNFCACYRGSNVVLHLWIGVLPLLLEILVAFIICHSSFPIHWLTKLLVYFFWGLGILQLILIYLVLHLSWATGIHFHLDVWQRIIYFQLILHLNALFLFNS